MSATEIATKYGLTLGKLSYGDTRRIVNHESMPFYVARDGRIIEQFKLARYRTAWLEDYDITYDPGLRTDQPAD